VGPGVSPYSFGHNGAAEFMQARHEGHAAADYPVANRFRLPLAAPHDNSAVMQELELKFVLNEQSEKKLRESPALKRLAGGRPSTASLHTIYFDTPDRALKAAGIALRLRRKGRSWVQTVKAGKGLRSGLSNAIEVESRVPTGKLDLERLDDPAIRAEVKRRLGGLTPEPVCETVIRRTTRALTMADGSSIELAIDVGEVRARDRAEPWREAELELISGAPAALFAAARELFPEGGLEFSNLSKAQRGYLLSEQGRISLPVEPRRSRPVALAREMAVEEAAVAVLRECLDQIAANVLAILRGDDPEGSHQLRVGLRRLRAGLVTFRPALGGAALERLADEAKWLGRQVGRQRDLDVVLHDVVLREAGAHPDEAGLAALAEAVQAMAAAERARLRETLKGGRVHAFLLDLAAFVETGGWLRLSDKAQGKALAAPVRGQARASLAACWRRVAKRARGIGGLDAGHRHELRKSLKRLRYMVEFLAPLYREGRVTSFLERLKALQDIFGELNDRALAEAVLTGPGAPAAGDPAVQRAVGRILGSREHAAAQAWESAKKDWAVLKAAGRFWE